MNATVTVSSVSQRCAHRNYSDFVVQCGECMFLCARCVYAHLREHTGQRHFISQSLTEEKLIEVSLVLAFHHAPRRWDVSFSNLAVFSLFFSQLPREIESIELVATRKSPLSPCVSLFKFDKCRSIAVSELELRTDDSARSFAAWIHCQRRLRSLAVGRVQFNAESFPYLPPGIALNSLLDLSLYEVLLPDGGLGEAIRRVLSLGKLERLALSRMKLGETDALALARVAPQGSLAELELNSMSLLVRCSLDGFLSRLHAVQKVAIRGSLYEAVAVSVARMRRLRELRVDCEERGKLKKLALVAPAMPQLSVLVINGASLPLGNFEQLVAAVVAITLGRRNTSR